MLPPEIVEVCQVDWKCLWSHAGNPLVWAPVAYGALTTLVALTPTDKDDKALERAVNLAKKYKDIFLKIFNVMRK